ncbi:DUF4157 domain-containing protein [Streptomyces sp. NPDC000345]|uniref:eCIS core domain-containing protein n=1 Tax=Streptomyces sp. NPDC000345 TaxID=3364537 RepID=UPI00369C1EA6
MRDRENARSHGSGSDRGPAGKPAPAPASPLHGLAALQSTAGNAAVVQLLRQAARPRAQPEPHQHGAGCGHEETGQAAPSVQRSAVHDVLRTPGQPMDDATRTDMEARLGADFSDVRIHTDAAARASAAEVGARAYTSGSHVVIGDGGADKHTLAHELTHVIQQRQGPVAGTDNGSGLKVSDPSDRYEREAEANATRVMSAAPVQRSSDGAPEPSRASEGGVIQRTVTTPADAQTQNDQVDQLSFLTGFWVPAETFGDDGEMPPEPTHARLLPAAATDVDVLRVQSSFTLPRRAAGRRGGALHTQWTAQYQSSFFLYTIELINDPHDVSGNRVLIDTDAPFRITRRTLRGSGGRSGGRTYAFGDRWGVNPAAGLTPDEAMQRFGLDADSYVDAAQAGAQNLTLLPFEATQPVVHYVPAGRHDPKFLNNDRRFLSAQNFDALGQTTRFASGVSSRPQVDRRDGQRGTAAAMAGTQAHQWMGPGNGGGVGQLAKYEWCHLIGDGDGGPSIPANLVIGTNAVNTEQLAMETGLRELIPQVRARGYDIRLDVTASVVHAPGEQVQPASALGLPDRLQADWISYAISLVPVGNINGTRTPVHRQIMDATRGTITESEFVVLQATVKRAIRTAVGI